MTLRGSPFHIDATPPRPGLHLERQSSAVQLRAADPPREPGQFTLQLERFREQRLVEMGVQHERHPPVIHLAGPAGRQFHPAGEFRGKQLPVAEDGRTAGEVGKFKRPPRAGLPVHQHQPGIDNPDLRKIELERLFPLRLRVPPHRGFGRLLRRFPGAVVLRPRPETAPAAGHPEQSEFPPFNQNLRKFQRPAEQLRQPVAERRAAGGETGGIRRPDPQIFRLQAGGKTGPVHLIRDDFDSGTARNRRQNNPAQKK